MAVDTTELKLKGLQIVRGFFASDVMADLLARAEEVRTGVATGALLRDKQFATGLPETWFQPIYEQPALLDLISDLLGPDLCLGTWRVLMKDSHFNGPVSVHQDWAYFGGDTRKINVFVPLTRVHTGNGAMTFYERSHQMGPVERGAIDVKRYPFLAETCPQLEVGDILLADFLTWHASVPASSDEARIMIQLVYQPSSDPSSKHLIAGEMINKRNCPDRFEPLMEPLTQVSCVVAREFLAAGDKTRALRYARGAFASDPGNAEAALMVHDLLTAKGDPEAAWFLAQARDALARLNDQMAAHTAPQDTQTIPAAVVSAKRPEGLGGLLGRLTGLRQPA
jgi:hypothetical protein